MNSSSKRVLLVHIAGCMLFLALPVLSAPESSVSFSWLLHNPPTQRDLLAYLLLLLTFYANYLFFVPQFYFKKRYDIFVIVNLLCLVAVTGMPGLLISGHSVHHGTGFMHRPGGPPRMGMPSFFNRISRHLFLFLLIVFFSLMLHISNRWKQAEKEKLNSQLAFLRTQINPHFLFNTLNSIYSLTLVKSDQAPAAVVKLSGMMRYVLNDAGKAFVSLQEELNYVADYIALQQIRFEEDLNLLFTVNGSAEGKKIAPLLLIPFIENAFKYGVNAEEEAAVAIHITIAGEQLDLHVHNKKVKVQLLAEHSSGLGIDNTQARLQLLYPGMYTLRIEETDNDFTVQLSIQLI